MRTMIRRRVCFLATLAFAVCFFLFKSFLSSRSPTARSETFPWRAALDTADRREAERNQVGFVEGFQEHIAHVITPEQPREGARAATQVRLPPDQRYMARPRMTTSVPASPQKKVIVVFNRPGWLFDSDPHYQHVFDTCLYSCVLSDDRSLLPRADAVWADMAQLHEPGPPPHRPPHQMWVAYNIESPVHFQGYQDSLAWRTVFNWTFSYRVDSDFFRPYGDFQLRPEPPAPARKNYSEIVANKTIPIAWFVSNCYPPSRRQYYVQELQKYIGVDIYGSCGTLQCPGLAEERCFGLLNTTYYFYLSFENSYCEDYVTEKLFKTYRNVNVIPIVRGAVNYTRYLPPNTYLDTANFSSPRHLAEYLHSLIKEEGGARDTTYTGMLRTKDRFYTSFTSWVRPNLRPFCELCQTLQVSPPAPKVYPDIMAWHRQAKCWNPTDI